MNDTHAREVRHDLPVVRRRNPWTWVIVVLIALIVLLAVQIALTNKNLQWSVVGEYLFSPQILAGVVGTLELTVVSMVVGSVIGVVVAVGRLSSNRIIFLVCVGYAWLFRAIPVLVQLLFWFYLAALLPRLSIGIPFGPTFASVNTNDVMSPFLAAVLGLGLSGGAYQSEIIRSGILAVPKGQTEASLALGMTESQVLGRIVLPQAMRVIVPPWGNELISTLKSTSLVVIVGYAELLTSASRIYARTYQTIPLLIVAAIWYLFMTIVLSYGQYHLERYLGRGYAKTGRTPPPTGMRVDVIPRGLVRAGTKGSE